MKLSLVCFLLLLVSFLVTPENALGQSNPSRPTSDQSLQELVREVQQLRATIQRMNTTMYKGQVLLERLKFQQEQVARMSRELVDARENLSEIRAGLARLKEMLPKTEAGVDMGAKHPAELAGIKAELEHLKEREQRLITREAQLAGDLEMERARLNDLNDRLNAFEWSSRQINNETNSCNPSNPRVFDLTAARLLDDPGSRFIPCANE